MIRKPINQSIKLVNWYWSIDDQSITTQNRSSIGIDWNRTSKQTSHTLPVRSTNFGKPWDEIGKTIPTQSAQRIYPIARVLELPTCPPLPFHVTMSSRDIWVEALLNIRCTLVRCLVQTTRGENGSF